MIPQISILTFLFVLNFTSLSAAQVQIQEIQGNFELNDKEILSISGNSLTWWKWPDDRRVFHIFPMATSGVERLVKFQDRENQFFWNAFMIMTQDGFWVRNGLIQYGTPHGAELARFWIPELGFQVKRTSRALPLTPPKCPNFTGTYNIDEKKVYHIEQRNCYFLKMILVDLESPSSEATKKQTDILAEGREFSTEYHSIIPYFEEWEKTHARGYNHISRHKTTMTETSLLRELDFAQGHTMQLQLSLSENACGQNIIGLEAKIYRKRFPYDPTPEQLCLVAKRK